MKTVSQSLMTIHKAPELKLILDRSRKIEPLIPSFLNQGRLGLCSRKPKLDSENLLNLDLSTFLHELTSRQAVVTLNDYERMRPGALVKNDHVRHGKMIGLISHREVFSFSITVLNLNRGLTEGPVQNFAIQNIKGAWYSGSGPMTVKLTPAEKRFLKARGVLRNGILNFKYFIHPRRWKTIHSRGYFLTKALILRLRDEAHFHEQEIQNMIAHGVRLPPRIYFGMPRYDPIKEAGEPVQTEAFQIELDIPEMTGTYPRHRHSSECLEFLMNKRKRFLNHVKTLQFNVRCSEWAYFKYGICNSLENFPSWIKDACWSRNYKKKYKRISWDRFVLVQPVIGKLGIALRKRSWVKTERVSSAKVLAHSATVSKMIVVN